MCRRVKPVPFGSRAVFRFEGIKKVLIRVCLVLIIFGVGCHRSRSRPSPTAPPAETAPASAAPAQAIDTDEAVLRGALDGPRAGVVRADAAQLLTEWEEARRDYRSRVEDRMRGTYELRTAASKTLLSIWCTRSGDIHCVGGDVSLGPGAISREDALQRFLRDAARVDVDRFRLTQASVTAASSSPSVDPVWCSRHMLKAAFLESTWTRGHEPRLWLLFVHDLPETARTSEKCTTKR